MLLRDKSWWSWVYSKSKWIMFFVTNYYPQGERWSGMIYLAGAKQRRFSRASGFMVMTASENIEDLLTWLIFSGYWLSSEPKLVWDLNWLVSNKEMSIFTQGFVRRNIQELPKMFHLFRAWIMEVSDATLDTLKMGAAWLGDPTVHRHYYRTEAAHRRSKTHAVP